jgi:hypothetical protein
MLQGLRMQYSLWKTAKMAVRAEEAAKSAIEPCSCIFLFPLKHIFCNATQESLQNSVNLNEMYKNVFKSTHYTDSPLTGITAIPQKNEKIKSDFSLFDSKIG